jgi:FHA domain
MTIRPAHDHDNCGTIVYRPDGGAPNERPLGPREAFLLAYERLSILGSVARGPAMVVVAVGGRGAVLDGRTIEDQRSLVVGRHTQCSTNSCGLYLPSDAVSLRHIAALVRAEQGQPVLRIWDLNTGLNFTTEDGQTNAAVISEGPTYVAVGGYALWFLPASGVGDVGWPARAQDAWQALPPRDFIDRKSPGPARPKQRPALRSRPDQQGLPGQECTSVTSVAPPLLLGDDDEPEVAWGVIRLERYSQRQQRGVSAERLEQGILVGRYERCGILMSQENESVSRVHLLLVRIGTEVWAIHTASTNGLFRGDAPVEAEVLGDADALRLASDITLRWKRTVHPEA